MSIRRLSLIAVLISLMIVLTCIITIPIGINGYINLSDLLIMLLSGYLSPLAIIMVGGVGCAISDIILGYSNYALFSFVIKSLEGLIMYYLLKRNIVKMKTIVFIIGAIIMMFGYGLVDSVLYREEGMFMISFMANLPQGLICAISASLLYIPFRIVGRKIDESK